MLKNILTVCALALFFTACTGQTPPDLTKETGKPQSFGAKIKAKNAIGIAELAPKMEGVDSMQVKVKGTVESVCQKKGCWMNVTDGQSSQKIFVKFKDYGFFMPKEIAGREIIMDGYAFRTVTPVEELRHYAEDEGKSKAEIEAITQPKEELQFLATGVLLLPEGK